jgi:hypothetical protein
MVIFLFSCKNKLPKDILEQKKMEKVLWDVLKVDAYTKNYFLKDTTKNIVLENAKMQFQVFALHNITKDQFYKSYRYYLANSNLIKPLLDSIANNSNKEKYIKYSTGQQGDPALVE